MHSIKFNVLNRYLERIYIALILSFHSIMNKTQIVFAVRGIMSGLSNMRQYNGRQVNYRRQFNHLIPLIYYPDVNRAYIQGTEESML